MAGQSAEGDVTRDVSVVVPTFRNHALLRRVLDGYDRQSLAAERFEVTVVADPAEPDLAAVRAAVGLRRFSVRVLQGSVPGASGNRNVGWLAARAPVVLFTDDDTVPVRELLAEHVSWHRRHPERHVGVLGVVRWAPEVRVTPFMRWLDRGIQFDYASISGEEASWAHTYTSNFSVKRAFLELVGGFDQERLPYGYEDLDWGYRARDHGLRVLLNRRAVVDHWRTMTVQTWQRRAPRLAASEWTFCALHPVAPWFQRMFADAAARPPAGRRAVRLTPFISPRVPLLGPWVWERADIYWRQQIAPHFLAAWAVAAGGGPSTLQPGESAVAERGGVDSPPVSAGPK